MYITLYTARQLRQIKDRVLWLGLFMAAGGAAAFIHHVLLAGDNLWLWAVAALLVLLFGVAMIAVGTNKLFIRDAYVSITPVKVSYRLNFYSSERAIEWKQVSGIQISDNTILIDMHSRRQKEFNLSSIQSNNMASHVAVSLRMAALERNVSINGVRFNVQTPKAA
jgi:hypothetical protein